MFSSPQIVLAIFALLVIISIYASKLSAWLRMPGLILFLIVGMLAGSEGVVGIDFENAKIANFIGTIALAFILFSGGFDTPWGMVRKVFARGILLSTIAVLLTALFTGCFAYYFLDAVFPSLQVSFAWCLLLGSIVSSTDAAAVFSILRSKNVSLKGELKPMLEFESGSNDPMATFLTLFMLGIVMKESASDVISNISLNDYIAIIPMFILKMSVGIILGYVCGKGATHLYNRINLSADGLYHVLALSITVLTYSLAEIAYGNGFMAVYVAGMTMGNQKFILHNRIGRVYDGTAWLMQIILFVMLGLLAFPSQLWDAKWIGLVIALFLMLIARPAAVLLCMIRSRFSMKERCFISWVGLRGGAPIMLATFPLLVDAPHDNLLFHIVFFIVLTSVTLQGISLMRVAKQFKLDAPIKDVPLSPILFEHTGTIHGLSYEFEITHDSPIQNFMISQLKLPQNVLILLIQRQQKHIIPRGETRLIPGDVLMILAEPNQFAILDDIFTQTPSKVEN